MHCIYRYHTRLSRSTILCNTSIDRSFNTETDLRNFIFCSRSWLTVFITIFWNVLRSRAHTLAFVVVRIDANRFALYKMPVRINVNVKIEIGKTDEIMKMEKLIPMTESRNNFLFHNAYLWPLYIYMQMVNFILFKKMLSLKCIVFD